MAKTAILLIDCPDSKGIVAAVANFLVQCYDVNVLNADQHQDSALGLFFMRVEFETEAAGFDEAEFRTWRLLPTAERFKMHWRIEFADRPQRVAIFVSHYLHCLVDLLHRYKTGELHCELMCIVSNHEDARGLAEFMEVPFPLHAGSSGSLKAEVEARQMALHWPSWGWRW